MQQRPLPKTPCLVCLVRVPRSSRAHHRNTADRMCDSWLLKNVKTVALREWQHLNNILGSRVHICKSPLATDFNFIHLLFPPWYFALDLGFGFVRSACNLVEAEKYGFSVGCAQCFGPGRGKRKNSYRHRSLEHGSLSIVPVFTRRTDRFGDLLSAADAKRWQRYNIFSAFRSEIFQSYFWYRRLRQMMAHLGVIVLRHEVQGWGRGDCLLPCFWNSCDTIVVITSANWKGVFLKVSSWPEHEDKFQWHAEPINLRLHSCPEPKINLKMIVHRGLHRVERGSKWRSTFGIIRFNGFISQVFIRQSGESCELNLCKVINI